MARTEARLAVSIWRDADFRALTGDEQRLYMQVISQDDCTHAGSIALRERRWASAASDMTVDRIHSALLGLERARFVVVDWDAEEVLVRTFIRGDRVYRRPQILAAAAEQLHLITSEHLRAALLTELHRVAELDMADASRPILAAMIADLTPETRSCETAGGDGDGHSAGHILGDRGVVTVRTKGVIPEPLAPVPPAENTRPLAPLADTATEPEAEPKPRAKPPARPKQVVDEAFARFWEAYPRKEAKGAAVKVWARIAKDPAVDLDAVIAGAVAFRNDGPRQRNDPKFTAMPATWLNAQRWLDERPSGGTIAAPPGNELQERGGLMLGPANIANLERRDRMAALQAQRDAGQPHAIEGSTR